MKPDTNNAEYRFWGECVTIPEKINTQHNKLTFILLQCLKEILIKQFYCGYLKKLKITF